MKSSSFVVRPETRPAAPQPQARMTPEALGRLVQQQQAGPTTGPTRPATTSTLLVQARVTH